MSGNKHPILLLSIIVAYKPIRIIKKYLYMLQVPGALYANDHRKYNSSNFSHFSDPTQSFSYLLLTFTSPHFHLLVTAINYILNDSENV